MSGADADLAAWLAVALALGVAVLAVAMLRARSLFITAAATAGMSAVAAGVLLLLGGGDGALTLAAFGVGVAPVVLLGAVLLSARTAKGSRRGWIAHAIALAAAIGAAAMIAPEWASQARAVAAQESMPLWLALLLFAVSVGCVAVLGYGERGVLERQERGADL
jgi:hypothetical protein